MKEPSGNSATETIRHLENEIRELKKLIFIFEQIPTAMFLIDRESRFQYVNPGFTKLSGYSVEELRNKSIIDLFYHGQVPRSRAGVAALIESGQEWQGELLTYHKSGTTYWANTQIKPYRDDSGEISAFIVTQQDITDRKNIEKALQESEVKYKTLIENSHDGIIMIRNNQTLFANRTLCNMLGYTPEELYALPSSVMLLPEEHHKIDHIAYRRQQQDFSTISEVFNLVAKDGSIRECETFSTLMQFDGQWSSFFTVRDITESRRIEMELKKSEQKYRELAEMLPLAVYELDAAGNPTYMNQTGLKLFGIRRGSGQNREAVSFFSPQDRERMRQKLKEEAERLLPGGEHAEAVPSPPVEYMAKRADGTDFPVLIYGTAILEDGKVTGSRGIIVDISERKAMEDALRASEEKYKTFIENSQDGTFAIQGTRILFANNTFCRFIGYSQEELYQKSAIELVIPEDREKGMAISKKRAEGDTSTLNDRFRFLTRNGDTREGDVFTSVVELNGERVSYITVHDLTEIQRMQDALVKSEQKYRELAEMLPQTVFEINQKGMLRYLNKTGMEKFGQDFLHKDVCVFDLVIPEDLERMKRNFIQVSVDNIPAKGNVYTLRQVDGKCFEAMISASPLLADGKPAGSRGVVIDISEHVAMQKAVQESEEKYRTLIENATDGIVITQDGMMRFYNKAMADMLQTDMEEQLEKPFLNRVVEEDHQIMIDYHKRRMSGENFTALYRSRMIRKDGKVITVELNARTSNYNGRPAAFIVIRDISDRIKIEQELHYAKNELERLNSQLEKRVKESSKRLTEARTQLINLQKENLQSQFDVLKQQVNPHFLFNSLNVLTSLIKIEPDLAEKFSEQLSKVYRYVLENKDNELVELNTELNFLDAYIFLLNIRFVGKLVVNLDIPIESRTDKIIPLAMQLLIENAIKHNVMSKSQPLTIDIFVDEDNYLNIINNLQERPSQIISTGVGLKNILNRYQLLNLNPPVFEKSENQFIAKIQLIRNQ